MAKYLLLMVTGLLASCSFQVQPEPQTPWNEWVCASQVTLYWRADGTDAVQLRLGAGDLLHVLRRMPSDTGELYSDTELAFLLDAEQAQIYTVNGHNLVGRDCKAQPE